MKNDMLNNGLRQIGIPENESAMMARKLERYTNEILLFNSVHNIVGTDNKDDIIVRHIFDSLSPYKTILSLIDEIFAQKGADYFLQIADVGSGGGFPGIPLALAFPAVHFTLIERMTTRCAFLDNCKAVLSLENVSVKCAEVERVAQNSFDMAVFRAFKPFDKKILKYLLRILHNDGKLLAYKARLEKITNEMDAVKQFAPIWQSVPLQVPFLSENQRHLVIIPKSRQTVS